MKPPETFGHLFQRGTQLSPSDIEKIENCTVLPKEFWVHFCPQKNVYANRKPVQREIQAGFSAFEHGSKERLLFEIHAVSLAFGHKKAPLNCIKIEVQVWWRRCVTIFFCVFSRFRKCDTTQMRGVSLSRSLKNCCR